MNLYIPIAVLLNSCLSLVKKVFNRNDTAIMLVCSYLSKVLQNLLQIPQVVNTM